MTKMFKIALPDGSVREMPEGSTPADVAAAIGPGLAKAALAAKVDGEVRDIMRPFEGDSNLALITFSRINGGLDGQIISFFVMVVAAAEVVVGLAIIMSIFRTRRSASVDDANLLKY